MPNFASIGRVDLVVDANIGPAPVSSAHSQNNTSAGATWTGEQ